MRTKGTCKWSPLDIKNRHGSILTDTDGGPETVNQVCMALGPRQTHFEHYERLNVSDVNNWSASSAHMTRLG